MRLEFKKLLAVGVLAFAPFGFAGSAEAATMCDASIATLTNDGNGANDGCNVGGTNNDTLNPLQVNVDTMFTYSDWVFAGKDNGGNGTSGGVDISFSVSGGLLSGTWSVINTLFNTYTDLMVVIKGGNSGTQPNYVGYLFNSATDGDYSTPNFNTNGQGNPKDISHWSAYVRGTATTPQCPDGSTPDPVTGCPSNTSPIPLPAGLPLMLSVIGVGAYMRKRTRKAA